jgi:hypothetical protein
MRRIEAQIAVPTSRVYAVNVWQVACHEAANSNQSDHELAVPEYKVGDRIDVRFPRNAGRCDPLPLQLLANRNATAFGSRLCAKLILRGHEAFMPMRQDRIPKSTTAALSLTNCG